MLSVESRLDNPLFGGDLAIFPVTVIEPLRRIGRITMGINVI
jgi:hypothetical protein